MGMRFRPVLVLLVVYAVAPPAIAEMHGFITRRPVVEPSVASVATSPALVDFLVRALDLRKDFARDSYGPRITAALREAREGNTATISEISKALLRNLTDGGRAIFSASVGPAPDADLADLLANLRKARGVGHALPVSNEDARDVDYFRRRFKEVDFSGQLACLHYCNENFRNTKLDNAPCFQACGEAYPRN